MHTPRAPLFLLLLALILGGCQSTRERLLAQGYPIAFATGFEDGCGSGRQAAGALDTFRKNVPAYLDDRHYAMGWDDGFRQCQASQEHAFERALRPANEADDAWRQEVDRARGRAFRRARSGS